MCFWSEWLCLCGFSGLNSAAGVCFLLSFPPRWISACGLPQRHVYFSQTNRTIQLYISLFCILSLTFTVCNIISILRMIYYFQIVNRCPYKNIIFIKMMLVFISDVPYNGLFRKQKECVFILF